MPHPKSPDGNYEEPAVGPTSPSGISSKHTAFNNKSIKFNLGLAKLEPDYESLWFHAGRLHIHTEAAGWLKNHLSGYTIVTVELSKTWSCAILIDSVYVNDYVISWDYTAFNRENTMPIPPKGSGGLGIQKS